MLTRFRFLFSSVPFFLFYAAHFKSKKIFFHDFQWLHECCSIRLQSRTAILILFFFAFFVDVVVISWVRRVEWKHFFSKAKNTNHLGWVMVSFVLIFCLSFRSACRFAMPCVVCWIATAMAWKYYALTYAHSRRTFFSVRAGIMEENEIAKPEICGK